MVSHKKKILYKLRTVKSRFFWTENDDSFFIFTFCILIIHYIMKHILCSLTIKHVNQKIRNMEKNINLSPIY